MIKFSNAWKRNVILRVKVIGGAFHIKLLFSNE